MKRRIAYKVMSDPERYRPDTVQRALRVVRRDARRGRAGASSLFFWWTLRDTAWPAFKGASLGFDAAAVAMEEACKAAAAGAEAMAEVVRDGMKTLTHYRWETTMDDRVRPGHLEGP
jgi:hypothetical protein